MSSCVRFGGCVCTTYPIIAKLEASRIGPNQSLLQVKAYRAVACRKCARGGAGGRQGQDPSRMFQVSWCNLISTLDSHDLVKLVFGVNRSNPCNPRLLKEGTVKLERHKILSICGVERRHASYYRRHGQVKKQYLFRLILGQMHQPPTCDGSLKLATKGYE